MDFKRLVCMILTLVILAAIFPATVFAERSVPDAVKAVKEPGNDKAPGDREGPGELFRLPGIAELYPELRIYADEAHEKELTEFSQIKAGETYWYEVVLDEGEVLTWVSFLAKYADTEKFIAPFDAFGTFMYYDVQIVTPGDVVIPFDDLYDVVNDG